MQNKVDKANPEKARIRKAAKAFEMKRRELRRASAQQGVDTKRQSRQEAMERAEAWASTDETGDSAKEALKTPEMTNSKQRTRGKGNHSQGTPDAPNCDDRSRSNPDQICEETDNTQNAPEIIELPGNESVLPSEEQRLQETQRQDRAAPDETNPTSNGGNQNPSQFSLLPSQQTQRYLQSQLNNLPAQSDQWGNDARRSFQNYFKQASAIQSAFSGFSMPRIVSSVGAIP